VSARKGAAVSEMDSCLECPYEAFKLDAIKKQAIFLETACFFIAWC